MVDVAGCRVQICIESRKDTRPGPWNYVNATIIDVGYADKIIVVEPEEPLILESDIESLKLDIETLSSNAMRAMEIKDKEIIRLTAELERADIVTEQLSKELYKYIDGYRELCKYQDGYCDTEDIFELTAKDLRELRANKKIERQEIIKKEVVSILTECKMIAEERINDGINDKCFLFVKTITKGAIDILINKGFDVDVDCDQGDVEVGFIISW
jgi:hypothetical protein